jgi:DNA polymerase
MNPKISALKVLKQECLSCEACQLCEGDERVQKPHVFGWGNVRAKLMVVGQNPGYDETVRGRPFVGIAGKNFDEFLSSVLGIERKHIYITNTVKCYTPRNRGPYPEEMALCKHFLKKEIEIIKPKIILALGNYALQYFTKHGGISKCHGQLEYSKEFEINVFPMYHPSPLNMNKLSIRQITENDFRTLKRILENMDEASFSTVGADTTQ